MLQCLQGHDKKWRLQHGCWLNMHPQTRRKISTTLGLYTSTARIAHMPNLPNHTEQTDLLHVLPKSLTCYMRQTLPLLVSNGLQ